jgi:DNA-binding NarL/FixJ family response regulator
MIRSPRSVVAISGDPHRSELLNALLSDAIDYDVICVESVARGYARIKQLAPDLVILFSEIEDVAACQLLSMLKVDRTLSRIPVVTWATTVDRNEVEDALTPLDEDWSGQMIANHMN